MLNHPLSQVFHALADPTRRAIVERLQSGDAAVSELAKPLGMSLAAVVQHIQILEQSGVISTRKSGRVRTCGLRPDTLEQAETWIARRRDIWAHRLDRLGDLLAEETTPPGPSKEVP